MNAGTVFVLFLALGFLVFVLYLARLSHKSQISQDAKDAGEQHPKDSTTTSRRAG